MAHSGSISWRVDRVVAVCNRYQSSHRPFSVCLVKLMTVEISPLHSLTLVMPTEGVTLVTEWMITD